MYKKIVENVKEFKKDAILTPVFIMLEVLISVLVPYFMGRMIDDGIKPGVLENVLKIGLILVVLVVLAIMSGLKAAKHSARAATGLSKNLRTEMLRKIQTFSFSNIDKFSTGGIITRVTTDVSNIENAFQMLIRVASRSPIMMFFSLLMIIRINPELALIYLGIAPFIGGGIFIIIKYARPYLRKVFNTYDILNNVVQENISGIRVVKSYNRENYEVEKFKKVSGDIYSYYISAEKLLSFNSPLMQFAINTSTLLFSWVGANLIIESKMTTGELVSLFTYTMQILMSLMMFSMVFVMITISRESIERITQILVEDPEIVSPDEALYDVKDGSIEFENVDFSYIKDKERLSLIDVNVKINSGESVGIIGATGSSKTTLVQLIPRLYDVTDGKVSVGGVDVRKYDLTALRDSVAIVLQKNTLFSGTISENLRWGNPEATLEDMKRACAIAKADEFIEKLPMGYESTVERGGSNFSGGQKQRLCIARAILKNPKILILDDSTSAVDTKTDASIRDSFQNEMPNTTKIIIAQRISSIEHCDQIFVMEDGKIAAAGNHEYLMENNSLYREIRASQERVSA